MRTSCFHRHISVSLRPLSLLWVTVVFACFTFSSFCSANAILSQDEFPNSAGIVAFCFDGDTVKLTDRRVVRLAGIDTPEIQHGQNSAQYFSRAARAILETVTKGRKVTLLVAGSQIRDNYGRFLAELMLEDGTSVCELMIAKGAAFYYPHTDLRPSFGERLLALQKIAIKQRVGMWELLLDQPLAKQQYIGNRASLRFFPINCAEARRIKPRNKVVFGNLMDAFSAGYAPARICPFWPNEQ